MEEKKSGFRYIDFIISGVVTVVFFALESPWSQASLMAGRNPVYQLISRGLLIAAGLYLAVFRYKKKHIAVRVLTAVSYASHISCCFFSVTTYGDWFRASRVKILVYSLMAIAWFGVYLWQLLRRIPNVLSSEDMIFPIATAAYGALHYANIEENVWQHYLFLGLLGLMVGGSLLFLRLSREKKDGSRQENRLFTVLSRALTVILAAVGVWIVYCNLNYALATGKATETVTPILDKKTEIVGKNGSDIYKVLVEVDGKEWWLKIPQSVYEKEGMEEGGSATLFVYEGAFGIRHVLTVVLPES